MLDLLIIDSEAFFQIVSVLFYKGPVFQFIQDGPVSHMEILERFDKVCQSKLESDYKVPDEIRLQYLFFVANVTSKSEI